VRLSSVLIVRIMTGQRSSRYSTEEFDLGTTDPEHNEPVLLRRDTTGNTLTCQPRLPFQLFRRPPPESVKFRPRHIQMMALGNYYCLPIHNQLTLKGSAISTTLFFQSAKILFFSGPVSLWLAFLLMAPIPYAVLVLHTLPLTRWVNRFPSEKWSLPCQSLGVLSP